MLYLVYNQTIVKYIVVEYCIVILGGVVMSMELVFQLLNIALIIAIPIIIYNVIKRHTVRRTSINNKISNLENRVEELENKYQS
jgi:hypothetical protein